MNDKFTVRYGVGDLFVTLLIVAFFAAIAVFMLIFTELKAIAVTMLIILAVYTAALICPTVLFYLRVDGDRLYYRSRIGKKYEFSLSDIKSIVQAEQRHYRYGVKFFLVIKTNDQDIVLHHSMKGFGELAAYLIWLYSSGTLNSSVISKKCAGYLEKYSDKPA